MGTCIFGMGPKVLLETMWMRLDGAKDVVDQHRDKNI